MSGGEGGVEEYPGPAGVTIDYLIGGSDTMVLDKDLLQRMEDIQKLNDTDKGHLFALMDAFLQKVKLQQVLQ